MRPVLARPHNWLLHRILQDEVLRALPIFKGICVDVGCGLKPYGPLIQPYCSAYIGIDHPETLHTNKSIDIFADGIHLPVKSGCADTVAAFQVLEHVEEPVAFLSELHRVLKDGSYAIVTTPFIWGIHEQPRDFYRYTVFGLRHLFERAGFSVVSITANTGFWITWGLRFNYYLARFQRRWNKPFFAAVYWIIQTVVFFLDRLDRVESETAGYTSIVRRQDTRNDRPQVKTSITD